MLNRTEIERLAASAHALRPDWPIKSLCTLIARDLTGHAYRDVAVALAWVAADAQTRTPARIAEAGPWWPSIAGGGTDYRFERCGEPGHGSFPARNCSACRADQIATDEPVPTRPHPDPEAHARGAALAREALAKTRRSA